MLEVSITIFIFVFIIFLLMIVVRPVIDTIEADLTKELRDQEDIDLDSAAMLLSEKLSRYVYIENNKVKLKVRRK